MSEEEGGERRSECPSKKFRNVSVDRSVSSRGVGLEGKSGLGLVRAFKVLYNVNFRVSF